MRVEIRPAFDDAVMRAEIQVRKAAAKTLVLLQSLDFADVRTHPGLNFEKLAGRVDVVTRSQLYSIRISGSARAITCIVTGPSLVLISLHTQHDAAYRRRHS